jgi:hypothetical protein
MRWQDIEA